MSLTLEIVTPEARVYSDTVDNVVIPTVEGEIGVLPGHLPLLSQVADGELRVTKGGAVQALVIGDGFVQSAMCIVQPRRSQIVQIGQRSPRKFFRCRLVLGKDTIRII